MSEMKNTEAVTVSQPNYSAEIIAAMREGLTPKKMQEKVLLELELSFDDVSIEDAEKAGMEKSA